MESLRKRDASIFRALAVHSPLGDVLWASVRKEWAAWCKIVRCDLLERAGGLYKMKVSLRPRVNWIDARNNDVEFFAEKIFINAVWNVGMEDQWIGLFESNVDVSAVGLWLNQLCLKFWEKSQLL